MSWTDDDLAEMARHEAEVEARFKALETRLKKAEQKARRADTEKALALKAADRHLTRVKELEVEVSEQRARADHAECAHDGMLRSRDETLAALGQAETSARLAEAEAERMRAENADLRGHILAAARALSRGLVGDVQEELHAALGIDYDADPHDVPDGGTR